MLDEVKRWAERANIDRPEARIGILRPSVQGVPIVVAIAPERGADGRVLALFGVAYARSVALRTHVGHVLHSVALLPAIGGDRGDSAKVDNTELAVRLHYASGYQDDVSSSAADVSVWRSAFIATSDIAGPDGGFTVEVALPEHVGQRYVDAATPLRSEQMLLGGVLLLGLGFAAAAALGLRRQYRLAEARHTFVAAVSHELRTPLAHVNALSETLLLGRAESPEQAQPWLRAIHREGRRLSVLTENVLLHARGEQRGIRPAPQCANISAVVHDAVTLIEAQAQARSARIVIAGTAVDGMVAGFGCWIDADAVRQIVINFIGNALKFGPDGQTVTVTVDIDRQTRAGAASGVLRVSVDDEGPGIPPADHHRIWQPFVRLAEGGTAPTGTGFGLSVVRQLVEELGGRWSVGNVPGRGAQFRVELPLEAPAPRVAGREEELATPKKLQQQRFAATRR